MDETTLARALHVLGVVMWIGGVGMVTTVLLPALRRLGRDSERMALFETIEGRFARQARFSTLLVGLTGFYMTWALDLWERFLDPTYWWMHAMVAVWLLFTVMLFVLEPLVLHRWFAERGRTHPASTYRMVTALHWLLLTISLVTVAGAVAGSHGAIF
jgi:uncharacterized membrane protein